jgi:hypothetical protein
VHAGAGRAGVCWEDVVWKAFRLARDVEI